MSEQSKPDLLAEQSVLGGMMLSKRAAHDVVDTGVVQEDFYLPKHGLIFAAIVWLLGEGLPCDVIAVTSSLSEGGELERAGGAHYLHELTSLVPTASNAAYYADVMLDAAIKRRLVSAGMRIVQMGNASEGNARELAENARAELDRTVLSTGAEVTSVADVVDSVSDSLHETPTFARTPWTQLNDLIDGVRPGGLYVVGARPGDGKTIVGLQLADYLARRGPVGYASLEMPTTELTKRLIAMHGGVHMTALTRHVLTPHDWERIDKAREYVSKLPLFVDDRSGVTITQIRSFARTLSRRGPLQAIVVDYLQLINSTGSQKARWEVVGEYTRALKIMARELDVPVIVLSQLNRQSADGGRAPTLADLRESGSIEQDADVVMLLQRVLDEVDQKTDELSVYVAKNRHGQTGKVSLFWEGHFARVSSWPY